jgi:hypothetical protein
MLFVGLGVGLLVCMVGSGVEVGLVVTMGIGVGVGWVCAEFPLLLFPLLLLLDWVGFGVVVDGGSTDGDGNTDGVGCEVGVGIKISEGSAGKS